MNCLGAGLLALIACLGNPDPEIRDKTAFERISAELRGPDAHAAQPGAVLPCRLTGGWRMEASLPGNEGP